jgi:hypothetical protein
MNRTAYWENTRKKLKQEFLEKGITTCEGNLSGCMRTFGLSFAHRHKRHHYYSCPEKLGDFNEVLLLCASCHAKIEYSKSLTEKLFEKLR